MSDDRSMSDVEFFWDPVCPWAWITSRWVEEVAAQRSLDVDWRFISLRMVNADRPDPTGYLERARPAHQRGLRMLRIAAAVRDAHGRDRVGPLYTAIGTRIHVAREAESLDDAAALASLVGELGFADDMAKAADDERWDEAIRADTDTALERAGKDVGTPVLTFGPPDGPSFFGPVISRIPRGDEAVDLWNCVEHIAHFPGFAELKRSTREKPQTS
jgi:2-hydroxychromene-2-carboxylate isomerase